MPDHAQCLAVVRPHSILPLMRLWTVHPQYLDSTGLVAAWREALLAQEVLSGATRGYRHHPQLARFQSEPEPLQVVAAFLLGIAAEAEQRGYRFDITKVYCRRFTGQLVETRGQLLYEWRHLKTKLRTRSPRVYRRFCHVTAPVPHRLFRIVPGEIRDWEKR